MFDERRDENRALPRRQRARADFGAVRVRATVAREGEARPEFREPRNLVGLHQVAAGAIEISAASGVKTFGQGAAFALSHERKVPFATRGVFRMLSILVPAEVVSGVTVLEPQNPYPVRADSALLEPTFAFAERALATAGDAPGAFSGYYLERLLQEMTIGVLVEGARASAFRQEPDAYGRAIAVIAAQCSDPGVTPATVAEHVKLSLRQLQRVFGARGTTIERAIRRARVDHAVGLLTDRAYDAMSVEEIGRYSGFAGGSSLARAMAAEGSDSPARVRRSSQHRRRDAPVAR